MKKLLAVVFVTVLMLIAVQAAFAESYPEFNFETRTVTLNSGYEMPMLGLGMFSLSDSQAENSTYWALKAGFRLIDSARIYGNEEAVGRGLRRAIDEGIVTREEVFITTDTGNVDGSFLTDKVVLTQTDTGDVDVPKLTSGGRCEITTDTGDISISIK